MMLREIIETELMKPEFLAVVIRRLQVEDLPVAEKETLLKEWAGRARRTLPEWALASLMLPPSELT